VTINPSAPAISARAARKSFGDHIVLDGIDLTVTEGTIFALLGPNGAGKTSTVEILEGYRRRDGGEVAVLGCDPGRDRAKMLPHVGIVLQKTGVDKYLTVIETVQMYAARRRGTAGHGGGDAGRGRLHGDHVR
jgi:ABC-2 type transport system ATP-binding protein